MSTVRRGAEGNVGTESRWGGGVQPYGISNPKMGMWLFIVSDALTFAALLFAYGYLRNASPSWPRPFHLWPEIGLATLMTLCLLASGRTMTLAVNAARRGDPALATRWVLATVAGGFVFLGLHLEEWHGLWRAGVTLRRNPWGEPLFGGTFFTLTGMHMLHVVAGLGVLAVLAHRLRRGRATAAGVELCGLYWHFVELVWVFLFPMLYLLSARSGAGS